MTGQVVAGAAPEGTGMVKVTVEVTGGFAMVTTVVVKP